MEAFVTKLLALRLSLPVRYGLATLLIGVVTGIRLLLADFLAGYPYLLYFPVVIICALVLEHGTSLYATFLCGFLAVFLFVEPRHQLGLGTTGSFAQRYVKRHGLAQSFQADFEGLSGCGQGEHLQRAILTS